MNVALFLPNWLGDLVMATPAIRAVREHFGADAHLVGIMRPNLADVLDGTGWLDRQWYFDPRAGDSRFGTATLIRRMRQFGFDVALLFTNSFRTALLAASGRAKRRIGYARAGRGALLTDPLPFSGDRRRPEPMVEYYSRLVEAAGCTVTTPRLELAVTDIGEQAAWRIWRDLRLRRDGRVVALHTGGAYGSAKRWPAEHAAALACRIADRLHHDVLILCGPREREEAWRIERAADHSHVRSLTGYPLSLAAIKSCLARSCLLVSTDSGPRHVAAALGKPVITLFGPTSPRGVANSTVRSVNIANPLPCAPCAKRACPHGHHRCMQELSPDTVFAAVAELLTEKAAVRAA